MDLIDRFGQVKCSAKEEDFLTYTPNDILFLFGNVIRPVGLILNHDDPSECFVLFPSAAPMQDTYSLNESPSWVGTPMQLTIKKPHLSILPIVTKLLEDKALEEGEEYEYIPIELLELKGAGGPGKYSTPKRGEEPVATVLAKQLKSLGSQELQQIRSAIQLEMRRPDRMPLWAQPIRCPPSFRHYWRRGPSGQISPKLSAFSGERAKGEVSFEQWSYELQTLRKTYSDSALSEGIQHSLRGAAADTVCIMGPNVPLDKIIKKLKSMVNVKSFWSADEGFWPCRSGVEETILSFATEMEGLLSQIRDRFPDQPPHQKEQKLLKDHLFHGRERALGTV